MFRVKMSVGQEPGLTLPSEYTTTFTFRKKKFDDMVG